MDQLNFQIYDEWTNKILSTHWKMNRMFIIFISYLVGNDHKNIVLQGVSEKTLF